MQMVIELIDFRTLAFMVCDLELQKNDPIISDVWSAAEGNYYY